MTTATHVPAPLPDTTGWLAGISLGYCAAGGRTVLAQREHSGPLRVQKALYPEGDAVCHTLLLHPPGGIAGGDRLRTDISAGPGAHALITTPGAGKWYGSKTAAGRAAASTLALQVCTGATVEWLPQENIVFDGAQAHVASLIELETGARFIGMDLYCLGRTASGEHFTHGTLHLDTRITQGGRTLWLEKARIAGDSPLLHSPAGLADAPVFGTLLCAGFDADDALLAACRAAHCVSGDSGVTRLPGLLVARYRGTCTQAARAWFMRIWALLIARAAYHLGNRHVAVEVQPRLLRLAADHVLAQMLTGLGLDVIDTRAPFEPEAGAYGGQPAHHAHAHAEETGAKLHLFSDGNP